MQVPPPLGGCDAAFHAACDEMEALRLRSRRTAVAAEQVPHPPAPSPSTIIQHHSITSRSSNVVR
jgi:hypothetical protein